MFAPLFISFTKKLKLFLAEKNALANKNSY